MRLQHRRCYAWVIAVSALVLAEGAGPRRHFNLQTCNDAIPITPIAVGESVMLNYEPVDVYDELYRSLGTATSFSRLLEGLLSYSGNVLGLGFSEIVLSAHHSTPSTEQRASREITEGFRVFYGEEEMEAFARLDSKVASLRDVVVGVLSDPFNVYGTVKTAIDARIDAAKSASARLAAKALDAASNAAAAAVSELSEAATGGAMENASTTLAASTARPVGFYTLNPLITDSAAGKRRVIPVAIRYDPSKGASSSSSASSSVTIRCHVNPVALRFPLALIAGLFLFFNAPAIAASASFYYGTGFTLGAVVGIGLLLFILFRNRRSPVVLASGAVAMLAAAAKSVSSFFDPDAQKAAAGFSLPFLAIGAEDALLWIAALSLFAGCAVCVYIYIRGPLENPRAINVMAWGIKALGALLIAFFATQSMAFNLAILAGCFSWRPLRWVLCCGRGSSSSPSKDKPQSTPGRPATDASSSLFSPSRSPYDQAAPSSVARYNEAGNSNSGSASMSTAKALLSASRLGSMATPYRQHNGASAAGAASAMRANLFSPLQAAGAASAAAPHGTAAPPAVFSLDQLPPGFLSPQQEAQLRASAAMASPVPYSPYLPPAAPMTMPMGGGYGSFHHPAAGSAVGAAAMPSAPPAELPHLMHLQMLHHQQSHIQALQQQMQEMKQHQQELQLQSGIMSAKKSSKKAADRGAPLPPATSAHKRTRKELEQAYEDEDGDDRMAMEGESEDEEQQEDNDDLVMEEDRHEDSDEEPRRPAGKKGQAPSVKRRKDS